MKAEAELKWSETTPPRVCGRWQLSCDRGNVSAGGNFHVELVLRRMQTSGWLTMQLKM